VKEATIRIIDLVVYAFAIAGGVFALAFPPATIQAELAGYEWLATFWGILLLVAGTLGFIGRLTRIWLIEIPGTAAAIAGELIYVFVLAVTSINSPTARVALCLMAIATLALVRRYVELQIFTTDPGVTTLTERVVAALRRRTNNTAGQHR
jgi:hypothetical protein